MIRTHTNAQKSIKRRFSNILQKSISERKDSQPSVGLGLQQLKNKHIFITTHAQTSTLNIKVEKQNKTNLLSQVCTTIHQTTTFSSKHSILSIAHNFNRSPSLLKVRLRHQAFLVSKSVKKKWQTQAD